MRNLKNINYSQSLLLFRYETFAPHAEGQADGDAAYARAQHRQRLERWLRVACGEQRTVQVSRVGGAEHKRERDRERLDT
jgi:hypothetical protein